MPVAATAVAATEDSSRRCVSSPPRYVFLLFSFIFFTNFHYRYTTFTGTTTTINNTSTIATAVAPAPAVSTAVALAATAPATAAPAAAGGARDVMRLEPLVCFISYLYFNTLMFILALGTIAMTAPPAPVPPAAQQQQGLETRRVSSPW